MSLLAYAAPNHLLYVPRGGGKLVARILDASKAALTGPPVTLAENALAPFSASRAGALTYRTVLSTPNPSAHSIDVDPKGDRLARCALVRRAGRSHRARELGVDAREVTALAR